MKLNQHVSLADVIKHINTDLYNTPAATIREATNRVESVFSSLGDMLGYEFRVKYWGHEIWVDASFAGDTPLRLPYYTNLHDTMVTFHVSRQNIGPAVTVNNRKQSPKGIVRLDIKRLDNIDISKPLSRSVKSFLCGSWLSELALFTAEAKGGYVWSKDMDRYFGVEEYQDNHQYPGDTWQEREEAKDREFIEAFAHLAQDILALCAEEDTSLTDKELEKLRVVASKAL